MSDISVQSVSRRVPSSRFPDLSFLVTLLQTTAEALQACGTEDCRPAALPEKPCDGAPLAGLGEIRCYSLFPALLREEKELLAEARARDIPTVLEKVHGKIFAVATLMKNVDLETQVSGYAVQLLGEQLEQPVELLLRVQNVLSDWRKVSSSRME